MTPERIWKCAGCGVQMPSTCECVTDVAVSWEPDRIAVWKHELRLETGMENIARDMEEGRFPARSEPRVVRIGPQEALAKSSEVQKLIQAAVEAETERLREVCGEARLILDTGFRQLGETVDYAPHVIEGVCNMLERAAAIRANATDASEG